VGCRICNNGLKLILDLHFHPPSDAFITDLDKPETTYPLRLFYCENCGLAQIDYVVDPSELFQNDYPYATGVTKTGAEYYRQFAKDVIKEFKITKEDFVVDIGGNDGTLLKPFFDKGCDVLNIDPSGIESCVPVWKSFWDAGTAEAVNRRFKRKAKVILATNVFAHVDDLHDFMRGIDILLADDGVFIIESPALEDMLESTQFDQIYHEHLSYLSERPVRYLVNEHNMAVSEVQHTDMHGGSNRYFIRRTKSVRKKRKNTEAKIETLVATVKGSGKPDSRNISLSEG